MAELTLVWVVPHAEPKSMVYEIWLTCGGTRKRWFRWITPGGTPIYDVHTWNGTSEWPTIR